MASKRTATRGRRAGFSTRAIHAGQVPDPATGAVMPPIYQVSTYRQPGLGAGWVYDYARTINPTRGALERNLAALEGGGQARCFASGMSAIAAVMNLLRSGDHVVVSRNVYGGTYRLFEGLLRQFGLDFSWVDTSDLGAIERAIRPATKMLYIETPTNPVLGLTDLTAASRISRKHKLRLVVDNTFMSPYFQKPFNFGADIVVHSTTKYLNGHSDVVGGAIVVRDAKLAERIGFLVNAVGTACSPFDAWLVLRGVKTLPYRMEAHQRNATAVARWLARQPAVKKVYYPGLEDDPDHALARRQMTGFGGMVSFDLDLERVRIDDLFARLRLFSLAESLGGVESLIEQPWTMSHSSISEQRRREAGISPATIRLSIGIEHPDDLIEDLARGLSCT